MIVHTPTPAEILEYTKLNKIKWFKLNSEEFWHSSDTRYWSFTLDINYLTYFRIQQEHRYLVASKLETMENASELYEYLKN